MTNSKLMRAIMRTVLGPRATPRKCPLSRAKIVDALKFIWPEHDVNIGISDAIASGLVTVRPKSAATVNRVDRAYVYECPWWAWRVLGDAELEHKMGRQWTPTSGCACGACQAARAEGCRLDVFVTIDPPAQAAQAGASA